MAAANQRRPPAIRKVQRGRGLPPASSTRLLNEKPLLPTNRNRNGASVNERRKRPPGRNANAGNRRSTRRRLRWTRESRSTRSGPQRSRPRSRPSRRNHKPKRPAGIKRRGDWKLRCGARGTVFSSVRPESPFSVTPARVFFADRSPAYVGAKGRRRWGGKSLTSRTIRPKNFLAPLETKSG